MRAEKHKRDFAFPASFAGSGFAPLEPRVRIVGGGLTGILAAFQAHRMGARDIELYERLDRLGGIAQPDTVEGCDMREGCIYFGPEGDPIRALLEDHGAEFEEFDNRFGSVSSGSGEARSRRMMRSKRIKTALFSRLISLRTMASALTPMSMAFSRFRS